MAVHKATPISPPTGRGIRPVPNRNLEIYGKWSVQTYFRNAVTLVWGSLKLAPIRCATDYKWLSK